MKSGLDLVITARDAAGKEIYRECKEGDLYLWNFGAMFAHFLKRAFNTADPAAYGQTALDGTTIEASGIFKASTLVSSSYPSYVSNWQNTLKALVGSGTTAPAITDHNLVSAPDVSEAMPTAPKVITGPGNLLKVVMSATFPMTEEKICSECGLVMKSPATANGTASDSNKILLTRDIFDAVTVPAGGSLTIQFELWFNGTPPA